MTEKQLNTMTIRSLMSYAMTQIEQLGKDYEKSRADVEYWKERAVKAERLVEDYESR